MQSKRLIIETETQVLVEYHNNEQACVDRLNLLLKKLNIVKYTIKNVMTHVEIKKNKLAAIAQSQYVTIK